jgi:7-cyano-7-deazaguanine synthase in queuosine biosynthesis
MERIDVQRIVLDQTISFSYFPSQKHGIFLSGGLDSLSMLNWFAKEAPAMLENMTLFTIKKESFISAQKIAEFYNIKNHIFIEAGNKQGEAATETRKNHDEIFQFYAAITKNPSLKLQHHGPEAGRGERPNARTQLPFVDLDKRYTVQLGFDLKAPLQLSHTCTTLEVDHCGDCFMCAERRWAFAQLNLPDPAKYVGMPK